MISPPPSGTLSNVEGDTMDPNEVLQDAKQAVIAVLNDPDIELDGADERHLLITVGLLNDYMA